MLLTTHTTGIHFTDKMVEWTVLRKNRTGTEKMREETCPIPDGFFEQENAPLFPAEVLGHIHKQLRGIITLSLPSSCLLMRVLELPSTDPGELEGMIALQIDQISPFPVDQLTTSYEVLSKGENHSRVLAVAAPRKTVDQLGELFKEQGVYIRSLDAEILAWWSLLVAHADILCDGRMVLILEEHTEFSMIVVDDGVPVCFRSLELFHDFSDESVLAEIDEEIRYTLLSLETEYDHGSSCRMEVWSESELPDGLTDILNKISPDAVTLHRLNNIPSLAEGLAMRSAMRSRHHVELVPREWVELQRRRQILKFSMIASVAVLTLWLAVISITGTVFTFHKTAFNRVKKEAALYEEPAREAKEARAEMLSLEKYATRTHSALESLLEITEALPGSVEINSFDYSKGKAIRLRGSAPVKDPILDFLSRLGSSSLFDGIKDDKTALQLREGQRREGFSVTVLLPKSATEEQP